VNYTYKDILTSELLARKQSNAKFSLRAFARDLSLSPTHLSAIMLGKRNLTQDVAGKIVKKLALSPIDKRSFLSSAFPELVELQTNTEIQTRLLREDEFSFISEWYHLAIFSLGLVSANRASPDWLAKKLGISELQASDGLNRLKRLGLITVHHDGSYKPTGKQFTTTDDIPSSAIRKFHKQNLDLAKQKIDTVPVEKREYGIVTMAINPGKIKRAKQLIRDFQDQISKELKVGKRKEVYTLSIQLFPLTQEQGNSK